MGCERLESLINQGDTGLSGSQEVDYSHQNGRENDPEQLEPVEKRHTNEDWLVSVVKWRPQQDDERNE
jgi:hypothetical protein